MLVSYALELGNSLFVALVLPIILYYYMYCEDIMTISITNLTNLGDVL